MHMHVVAFTDKTANGITPIKLAHLKRDSRENTKRNRKLHKSNGEEKKAP